MLSKEPMPELFTGTKKEQKKNNSTHSKSKRDARDYEIFMAIKTHTATIPQLMKKYKLGQTRIYAIIKQREDANANWANNLITGTARAVHEEAISVIRGQLQDFMLLKQTAWARGELKLAGTFTKDIIMCSIAYSRMVREGPVYDEMKKIVDEAKRIIKMRE